MTEPTNRSLPAEPSPEGGGQAASPPPTDRPLPAHLTRTTTNRGFDHYPLIPSTLGEDPADGQPGIWLGGAAVYESSNAEVAEIWVKVQRVHPDDLGQKDPRMTEVAVGLRADRAWQLAEQIMVLCRDHYHGDARPLEGHRHADLYHEADCPGLSNVAGCGTRAHPHDMYILADQAGGELVIRAAEPTEEAQALAAWQDVEHEERLQREFDREADRDGDT